MRASNLASTGSYTLGLECLLPTSPIDATLACGSLQPGAIESAAEVDQLTFSGQTGQSVTLTLAQTGFPAFVNARATLFSPLGEPTITFDANSQQQLVLADSGTYIIQMRTSNLVSTGTYTIGLQCLLAQ